MSKNTEIIGLGDLKSDPQNARKHTLRNVAMIVDALQEVGAARSIVIDEKGVVLAGNATIKAAGQAGLSRVKVVDADESEIIPLRRTNLTKRQKKPWQDAERLYRIRCLASWGVLPAKRDEEGQPDQLRVLRVFELSSFPFAHEFLSAHV